MITIQVIDKQQQVFQTALLAPLELGRQQTPAEPLFIKRDDVQPARVAIARLNEASVSRKHVSLEPLGNDRVRVRNLSDNNLVQILGGATIAAQTSCELFVPTKLVVGGKTIEVDSESTTTTSGTDLQSLLQPTLVPGDLLGARAKFAAPPLPALPAQETERLLAWLQGVTAVLNSAAGSADFFNRAAQCMVDLVHLDCGRVLLHEQGKWRPEATCVSQDMGGSMRSLPTSKRVLDKVLKEKRTFWLTPKEWNHGENSLTGVQAVVAAPILNHQGQVLGVLYGDRGLASGLEGPQISKLEAMLVEVLASGVATGLARQDQQKMAVKAQVQFEQFFTAELSEQLANHPDLLMGRDSDVTLLFCDIRGFSRVSERLGPAKTVDWIHGVLSTLSECVVQHKGVLVDYIGDELMAMWGAPTEQADHAELACRAAVDMHRTLAQLTAEWMPIVGEPICLGIGLNSGVARVGNTGSKRKFKYGPLGNTVNLASRVQGATKYLKADVVITANTHTRLRSPFPARRLCTVRVVNIKQEVDLYELPVDPDAKWQALRTSYEQALEQFERQEFRQATRILGNILSEHPTDGPSLVLLSRAVTELINPTTPFTPIWELSGK